VFYIQSGTVKLTMVATSRKKAIIAILDQINTASVDACPVDCIRPKKNTSYDDGRPTFDHVPQNEENAQETRSVAQSWSAILGFALAIGTKGSGGSHNPLGNSSVAIAHLPSV